MPVAETYSAISGNFHVAFTNGAGQPSIEVTPVYSGVEAGKGSSPSRTCNSEGWVDFERNDRGTAIPDAQFDSHSISISEWVRFAIKRPRCNKASHRMATFALFDYRYIIPVVRWARAEHRNAIIF